jgi:G3E family GTPase
MKILIIGGFLGSGKTSVILQLARHIAARYPDDPHAAALLENEIGAVSVDDQVLAATGLSVTTLYSGCVCCTLAGEVGGSVAAIRDALDPRYLILEASGVAEPQKIREVIAQTVDCEIKICCLCDARRWMRLVRTMCSLMTRQLAGADLLLINKVEDLTGEEAEEAAASAQAMNPQARCFKISALSPISGDVLDALL